MQLLEIAKLPTAENSAIQLHTTDNIAVAMQELGTDDFTEEELRLVRIKFLSEVAN